MNDMTVRRATPADRLPIGRMLELYQHDLSDVWDKDLDVHGEYGYALDAYGSDPKCQAFAFLSAETYAGFALVDSVVGMRGPPGDVRWMAQFFVMKKYRRRGLGGLAAKRVFDQLRGRWEVGQMPRNFPAQSFWRRVISDYTGGAFVEHEMNGEGWKGVLQCFTNALESTGAATEQGT